MRILTKASALLGMVVALLLFVAAPANAEHVCESGDVYCNPHTPPAGEVDANELERGEEGEVEAAEQVAGSLPITGGDVLGMAVIGVAAIGLGSVIVLRTRRTAKVEA